MRHIVAILHWPGPRESRKTNLATKGRHTIQVEAQAFHFRRRHADGNGDRTQGIVLQNDLIWKDLGWEATPVPGWLFICDKKTAKYLEVSIGFLKWGVPQITNHPYKMFHSKVSSYGTPMAHDYGKPHMELPGRCLCPRLQVEQCSTLPCALLFPEVVLGKWKPESPVIRGKDSGVLHISQHQSLKCTSSNATWKHMETTPNSAISRWIYQFSVASISLSLLSLLSDMELGTLRSQVQCWIRCKFQSW
jgi:hypothetical protein